MENPFIMFYDNSHKMEIGEIIASFNQWSGTFGMHLEI